MHHEHSSNFDHDHSISFATSSAQIKQPPIYKVVLINDDYTPMDFVIRILGDFFAMDKGKATQIMLHVHANGWGICGLYTYEIAETKVAQVNSFSRRYQHPLLCTMKEA